MIHIEGIGKRYRLVDQKQHDTLRDMFTHRAGRLFKRSNVERSEVNTGEFWALKDISFDVEEGEVVGIIGRNGAGKSTLLKILSRVTPPTEGHIRIKGRVASLLEVGTGFHPEMTGRENIFMNGAVLGMRRMEIRAKLDEIVAFSEVEKFIDTPVKRYSSGMYVRLAFAVAAHLEPEILIVDEVLAVGDLAFQQKCLGKISEVARGGRTVLFVSHNMAAVASLTSRSVLLEKGEMIANDTTPKVIKTYLKGVRDKSSEISVRTRSDRSGDGRARVVKLSVMDDSGHADVLPLSRERKQIVIGIDCNTEVFVSKIALAVLNAERQRIIWMDSSDQIEPFRLSEGNHRITVALGDGVSPSPGDYYLNVALVGLDGMIDYVADAYRFTINDGDFFGTGRFPTNSPVVFVELDWAVDQSQPAASGAIRSEA